MQNEKLDQVDQANAIAEKWIGANEQAIRELVPEPKDELTEEDLLCDCGEVIPEKRARGGYINCVHCQRLIEEDEERRNKRYRRGGYDD